MHKIKHICFDLDGTLVDSYQTILKTTLKTLQHLKINEPVTESEFRKRIGHHFINIFNDLSIVVPDIEEFIDIYKSYYFEFIDSSFLYSGVIEVLHQLKNNDIKISLLTTKGQDQADKIIDHFHLRKYFDYIMGRRPDIEIKPSPQPLHFICNELKVEEHKTLLIGDTEIDIECGKKADAYSCAVTYGYRSEELLKAENPDFIIKKIDDLLIVLNDPGNQI